MMRYGLRCFQDLPIIIFSSKSISIGNLRCVPSSQPQPGLPFFYGLLSLTSLRRRQRWLFCGSKFDARPSSIPCPKYLLQHFFQFQMTAWHGMELVDALSESAPCLVGGCTHWVWKDTAYIMLTTHLYFFYSQGLYNAFYSTSLSNSFSHSEPRETKQTIP